MKLRVVMTDGQTIASDEASAEACDELRRWFKSRRRRGTATINLPNGASFDVPKERIVRIEVSP